MTKTTESVFAHQALQAPEDNVDQAVWVDSGCTRTVIRNKRKLINVCKPERLITFQGQGGEIKLTHIRDLPLVLQDGDGNLHKLLIKGCLHAAEALANLLATSDLQKARVGFVVPATEGPAKLCLDTDSGTVEFELKKYSGLHLLPFCEETMTVLAGVVSHRLRALNPTELWHWRLCHSGFRKISVISRNCVGIPRQLPTQDLPCHTFYDANM